MSNRLYNLAQEVTLVTGADGQQRPPHPSEMAVLLCLANDARDNLGGVTTDKLPTAEIRRRTRLSEAAVRKAYRVLQQSGHITRLPCQNGEQALTRVHPVVTPKQKRNTWVSPVQGSPIPNTGDPCIEDRGPYREGNNNHSKRPEHHAKCGRAREPAAVEGLKGPADPVDALFDRWDAMAAAIGIPGPATRSLSRRAAMAARIAEFGAGRLAMAIDTAERQARAGAFKRANGQGDLFLTIDALLGLGNARGMMLLERLLEGDRFGVAVEPGRAEPLAPPPIDTLPGEGAAEAEIRAAAAQLLGGPVYRAWLAPARLALGPDGLTITARSAFDAEHISNHIAPRLRRPGLAVRVTAERTAA